MVAIENDLKMQFGERLQRARKLRGLTLRGLSERMENAVSHAALGKYEKGLAGPGSSTLIAICRALDVDADYFFRETRISLEGIRFRKRSKFSKQAQERVFEAARDFFERYQEIEKILNVSNPEPPKFDLSQHAEGDELMEAVEDCADKLRAVWKLGQNPIQNVHEELEHGGVKVAEVFAEKEFDGFSGFAGSIPVVVLSKSLNDNLTRKRFIAAHELGHLVLQLPDGLEDNVVESLSHRFAGAFLMPRAAFKESGAKRNQIAVGELVALKEEWGLSLQAIMYRFRDLEIVNESTAKSFHFLYRSKKQWQKIGEPGEWRGSETSTRFRQLVFRAAAEELVTRSKAAKLLQMGDAEFDHAMAVVG